MLGLDLAVDADTGKTHSANHQKQQELKTDDEAFDIDTISYKKTLFKIDGNLTEVVETTPDFYASIYTIEYFTNILKEQSQSVINLSSGAKFSQTISAKTDTIKIKNIDIEKHIKEKLERLCLENSQNKLSNQELQSFKEKLKHAKSLQNFIHNYKKNESLRVDKYIEDICSNLTNTQDIQKYELSRVLDTFLHYIVSYIYDFFNSDNITEYEVHLKNISELLEEHLLKIINYYIESLQNRLT